MHYVQSVTIILVRYDHYKKTMGAIQDYEADLDSNQNWDNNGDGGKYCR